MGFLVGELSVKMFGRTSEERFVDSVKHGFLGGLRAATCGEVWGIEAEVSDFHRIRGFFTKWRRWVPGGSSIFGGGLYLD